MTVSISRRVPLRVAKDWNSASTGEPHVSTVEAEPGRDEVRILEAEQLDQLGVLERRLADPLLCRSVLVEDAPESGHRVNDVVRAAHAFDLRQGFAEPVDPLQELRVFDGDAVRQRDVELERVGPREVALHEADPADHLALLAVHLVAVGIHAQVAGPTHSADQHQERGAAEDRGTASTREANQRLEAGIPERVRPPGPLAGRR